MNRLTAVGGRCNDMITSTQMPQRPREVHSAVKLHVFQAALRDAVARIGRARLRRMVGNDDTRYSKKSSRSSYGAEVVWIPNSVKQKEQAAVTDPSLDDSGIKYRERPRRRDCDDAAMQDSAGNAPKFVSFDHAVGLPRAGQLCTELANIRPHALIKVQSLHSRWGSGKQCGYCREASNAQELTRIGARSSSRFGRFYHSSTPKHAIPSN